MSRSYRRNHDQETDVDQLVVGALEAGPCLGGPLAHGVLMEKNLMGPKNSWIIELDSGRLVAPVQGMARLYAVRIMDGRIYLDVNELNIPASKAEQALAALQYQGRQMNTWTEIVYDDHSYHLSYTREKACTFTRRACRKHRKTGHCPAV